MRSQQKLYETMSNQFMQCQKFFVRLGYGMSIGSGRDTRACFQRIRCLAKNWIFKRIAGYFPQRNESIDSLWKADGKNAVIAGGAQRFEIQIERPVESVR